MIRASFGKSRVLIRSSYAAYDWSSRTFTTRDIGLEGFGFDPDATDVVWVESDSTGRVERFDLCVNRSTAGERVFVCRVMSLVLVVELTSRKLS